MFKKAVRKQVKLKIAISGPAGSGKTYSALRLATGFGGKIAVIDTENGSASLYSDKFNYDVTEIRPPFTTAKYIEAINAAVDAGYENLVIDSISHAWNGEGGILDRKTKKDMRGGNSFTNWGEFTPEQDKFIGALMQSGINVFATMRSKTEYVVEANSKGKQAPRKVGLAPIQRDGVDYEFTTVFDVALNHTAETSKDRTGLFVDQTFLITEEHGEQLRTWQSGGAADNTLKDLLTEIEAKLKSCPDDYSESVGNFLDQNGNDKKEDILYKVLTKVNNKIQEENHA